MNRVLLSFALPQEYGPLKSFMRPWKLIHKHPYKVYHYTDNEKKVLLLETGMGRKVAQEALEWILKRDSPDLMISAGFGGSLSQKLPVGTVCLGGSFMLVEEPGRSEIGSPIYMILSDQLKAFCEQHHVFQSSIITANQPEPKQKLAASLKQNNPSLLDMETHFMAQMAIHQKIPFLCFRSVSDGVENEIEFDLSDISDHRGRVQIGKVIGSIVAEPNIIKAYWASWKRSSKAAKALALVLADFLELPVQKLQHIIWGSRLTLDPPE